jgi:hypothetical protein
MPRWQVAGMAASALSGYLLGRAVTDGTSVWIAVAPIVAFIGVLILTVEPKE